MIKHKAKAEWAAAGQAGALFAPVGLPAAARASAETPETGDNGGLDGILPGMIIRGSPPAGSGGPLTDTNSNAVPAARLELLRGKSDLLMRFMQLMIPVLVEVHA